MVDRKASGLAQDAGSQLAELRDTIASLGDRVSQLAASRAQDAKKQARSAARSVRASSSSLYDDGVDALGAAGDTAVYYGRRAGNVVKQNPGLSTLGLLVGVGVVAAIVYALREEEQSRWYDRPRGWF